MKTSPPERTETGDEVEHSNTGKKMPHDEDYLHRNEEVPNQEIGESNKTGVKESVVLQYAEPLPM